jgi:hypothetical protein
MCEKCIELDEKIAHFRRFTVVAFDPLTTDRIRRLIADLQRKRDTMHPSVQSSAE